MHKTEKKIIAFFSKYKFKRFKKGECLIRSGEIPRVFCLQKGLVRSISLLKNESEVIVNIFKPISFFPTNWVINDRYEPYNYEALTDVEVYISPKIEFRRFLRKNPDVIYDLLKRIYRGLEGYQLRVESLLSNNDQYKILVQILISIKRFGRVNESGFYEFKLDEEELASLTGLSRRTVVREITRLKKKGLLKYKDSYFTVPNLNFFEDEVFLI